METACEYGQMRVSKLSILLRILDSQVYINSHLSCVHSRLTVNVMNVLVVISCGHLTATVDRINAFSMFKLENAIKFILNGNLDTGYGVSCKIGYLIYVTHNMLWRGGGGIN